MEILQAKAVGSEGEKEGRKFIFTSLSIGISSVISLVLMGIVVRSCYKLSKNK